MKVIIQKGTPNPNKPHIFKCGYCSTIFKTDEYKLDNLDCYNDTFYATEIAECPLCNNKRTYEV